MGSKTNRMLKTSMTAIGRLYELLVGHADDVQLIDYLHWAVHDHMGLDAASRSDMEATVEALRKIPVTPE